MNSILAESKHQFQVIGVTETRSSDSIKTSRKYSIPNYKIEDTGDFELILDEHVNQMYIDIGPDFNGVNDFCNDVGDSWHETDGGNEINTPEEIFELIDSLLSNIDSIAWGQGSSADLQLPILSSPVGEYTILSIAQIGEGDSATIVSAITGLTIRFLQRSLEHPSFLAAIAATITRLTIASLQ